MIITSAFQHVSWISTFRSTAKAAGISLRVFAACTNPALSPACLMADAAVALPPVSHPQYIEKLLKSCLQLEVGLLVPGSPRELLKLACAKPLFESNGTKVAVPGQSFVSVSRDPVALDRIAVSAGTTPRGLAELSDVVRQPGNYSWPMDVLPRKWLNEDLDTLYLRNPGDLRRVPESAPVLITSRRSGRRMTVLTYFDDQGRLEWRGAVRSGILKGGGIKFAETIDDNEATLIVERMASQFHQVTGPVAFMLLKDSSGGLYLENMVPVLPKELSLFARAGSPIAGRLLLLGTGGSPEPNNAQWDPGLRLLFYDAPMILLRPEAAGQKHNGANQASFALQ
ncbi:MAG: hypothetical protein ABIQ66_00850 [Novosphingobium sp.]